MWSNEIKGQRLTNAPLIDQNLRGPLSEKAGNRLNALGSPWVRYASRRLFERVGILCICCFGSHEGRPQTEMFELVQGFRTPTSAFFAAFLMARQLNEVAQRKLVNWIFWRSGSKTYLPRSTAAKSHPAPIIDRDPSPRHHVHF
jgi:hypothetical protein